MNETHAAQPEIPGYDYGTRNSAVSPVSEEELRLLEQTAGWSETDARVLEKHADLFRQQAEHMVDSWRTEIGKQPHLAKWFFGPDGQPDEEYKARVKRRFVQWAIDVAVRKHDLDWLNYQEEIGLRHTPAKKNATDGSHTPSIVPLRYLLGFIPVVLPIRRFFASAIGSEAELQALEEAWAKAVVLHITLWSRPYATDGFWQLKTQRVNASLFADTPSLRIAFEGTGPVDATSVVLLHGFPQDVRQFDELWAQIAGRNLRVITPYLRGFGPTRYASDAVMRSGQQAALGKDVVDLLDALGIEKAILVG